MKLAHATISLVLLPVLLWACKGNPSTPSRVTSPDPGAPAEGAVAAVELKGRIVDDLDRAIAGAAVALHPAALPDPTKPQQTTTDGDGVFAFTARVRTDLGSANDVPIKVDRDGYESADLWILANSEVTITLYPLTKVVRGSTLRTRLVATAPYACGFESHRCRRITVEPAGETVVIEISDIEGEEVGLVDDEPPLQPFDYQRRVAVSDGEFFIIGGPATATLRAFQSADPLVGEYTLTLDHGCAEVPEDVRSRTYTASIDSTSSGYVVTLSDAEFYSGAVCTMTASRLGCHQFLASRTDDRVRFDLINADEWHGGYITEHLSPDRWLIVYGSAAGRLEAGAIAATGSASVTLCQGSYDAICQLGGKSCDVTDLRLTFTRR